MKPPDGAFACTTAEAAVAVLPFVGQSLLSIVHLTRFPDGFPTDTLIHCALLHSIFITFCSAHSLLPPHFPWRIIIPGVWLQKHVQYFPRLVNIVLPEGQPSTRENVKSIESWMRGSQPSIYPHLTLLLLMQFLFKLCQPAGFCHLMLYASTGQFKLLCTYKKTRIPFGSSHFTWNQGNISRLLSKIRATKLLNIQ